jgi:hypothetical protein
MVQNNLVLKENSVHGKLWDIMVANNYFKLIHFNGLEVLNLVYEVEQQLNFGNRRGKLPSITSAGRLLLYLAFL